MLPGRAPMWRWTKRSAAVGAVAALALTLLAVALDRVFPPDLTRLNDQSTLVLDKDGRLLTPFTAADGIWRLPATADAVDPRYLSMVIAFEDKRFATHVGVDPLAVVRAIGQWARAG